MSAADTNVFRTLPLDRSGEGMVALLRSGAAIVVALCVAWFVAVQRVANLWVWIALAMAVIVAVAWAVMGARSRARIAQSDRCFLRLDPEAIVLADDAEREIPWDHVGNVAIDLERLVVRISVPGEPDCVIEPRYGGLGVYDLEAAIKRAWNAVRSESSKSEG